MYPYKLFLGLDLYSILMTVGVIIGIYLVRLQGDMRALKAKMINFLLMMVPIAVLLGYLCAILVQGLYNIASVGDFRLDSNTGSTFYGGLLGGVIVGIVYYFGVGRLLFPRDYLVAHFRDLLDLTPAVVTTAHGFGRLGCLMAGCCHGKATDAWYGIETVYPGYRIVPVQLYEALFLFALSALLLVMMKKGLRHQMPTYMLAYGVWRFFIEYARADDRGQTIVSFLSPSQLFSLVIIIGAVALFLLERHLDRRAAGEQGGIAHG
ncbi:MAG: prolipoprotein diacylglyceryl transferase [Clostridia bacterium]|nr:prolipoprotein diacylglyceryl transferase [Clostridia bacterium]